MELLQYVGWDIKVDDIVLKNEKQPQVQNKKSES